MKTLQITVKMFYDDRDLTPPSFSRDIRIRNNGADCHNLLHTKCIMSEKNVLLCVCVCVAMQLCEHLAGCS